MYERNSIAGAAVDRMVNDCWDDYPEIFEVDKEKDAEGVTNWDRKTAKILKICFPVIKEADKRGLIGRYSAMLIQVKDNKEWHEEIDKNTLKLAKEYGLVRLIPVWEAELDVIEWDDDPNSEDYGIE